MSKNNLSWCVLIRNDGPTIHGRAYFTRLVGPILLGGV